MRKNVLAGISILSLGMVTLSPSSVYAFEKGGEDPLSDNTQNIKAKDSGVVEVDGWIGTFDPTKEPEKDQPTPDKNSDDWVDIDLPTKVLFGSLASDKGNVYSPKYSVKNNSIKKVKVSATSLENTSNPVDSDLKVDLKMDEKNINLIDNGTTYLSKPTELVTLESKGTKDFTLEGKYSGVYPTISEGAKTPKYNLNLGFEVVE